jgi:hypothetical protein
MRATLEDPALTKYAGRFVWLALNYDHPSNGALVDRYAPQGYPVFVILEPQHERVLRSWSGGATKAELEQFLVGPPPPSTARAIDERETALVSAGKLQEAAALAVTKAPGMPRERPFADVVLSGLSCANQGGDAPWAQAARVALEPLAREALALPMVLTDDRYQIFEQLKAAREQAGDAQGARRVAAEWLARIESDDKGASDVDSRGARDVARLRAARGLGQPARALPALVATERALPNDYTASLRLAVALDASGDADAALAAVARGLARAPGTIGRANLLLERATALANKGDQAGALTALDEADEAARAIGPATTRASLQARLARQRHDRH